jgi:hypothetical protein
MATAYTMAQVASGRGITKIYDPTRKPGRGTLHVRQVHMDFDNIATATGVALATNDTFQVMGVKKGELIIECGINILKVATGAAVFDLGFTSGDVDGLIDGVAASDVDFTAKAARGVLMPIYMYADDTLDILSLTASAAGCKADVWALIFRQYGTGV